MNERLLKLSYVLCVREEETRMSILFSIDETLHTSRSASFKINFYSRFVEHVLNLM